MHHKSKMADGRHLGKIEKSPYLSRGSNDIDEIGTMMQFDPLNCSDR